MAKYYVRDPRLDPPHNRKEFLAYLAPSNLARIRDVLDGDFEALWYAFTWSRSLQGHRYWSEISHGKRDPHPAARKWLIGLLKAKGEDVSMY